MPKIAAFPKAYMHALCKDGSMKLSEWFALAATLDVQGLEFYAGFLEIGRRTPVARLPPPGRRPGDVHPDDVLLA
jgi:hypothetical protein